MPLNRFETLVFSHAFALNPRPLDAYDRSLKSEPEMSCLSLAELVWLLQKGVELLADAK